MKILIFIALLISTIFAAAGCPPDKNKCNGVCVNLATDSNNCGSCGYRCDNGGNCVDGKCICTIGHHFCDPGIIAQNCSCCKAVCSEPGAPFYSQTAHSGGCPGVDATLIFHVTTAQECCLSCYNKFDCIQWAWDSPNHPKQCQQDFHVTDAYLRENVLISQSHCVNDLVSVQGTQVHAGGRCATEQIDACYPRNRPTYPREPTGDTCPHLFPYPIENVCPCGTFGPTQAPTPAPTPHDHKKRQEIKRSGGFMAGVKEYVEELRRNKR